MYIYKYIYIYVHVHVHICIYMYMYRRNNITSKHPLEFRMSGKVCIYVYLEKCMYE